MSKTKLDWIDVEDIVRRRQDDASAYSYSGRGMYGKECVAFTIESNNLHRVKTELDDAEIGYRVDNMGYGYVVYMPGIPGPEEKDDEN
jgi:hypothetical protein